MLLLNGLNQSQLNAVTQELTPLLILAGPGSGKTRVLTTRIAYLIKQQYVEENRCRAITFTRAATSEMRERLSKLGIEVSTFGEEGVEVSTIHGLAREIIDTFHKTHPGLRQICSKIKLDAPICWIDGKAESRYPKFSAPNGDTYLITPENCLHLALGHVVNLVRTGLNKSVTSFSWLRSLQMTETLINDKLIAAARHRFWERLASYVGLFHLKNYVNETLGQEFRANLEQEDLVEIHTPVRTFLDDHSIELKDFLASVALIHKSLQETKGLIDYTGQLLWAHQILKNDESVLADAQNLYKAYFVDEFQDTDPIQFDMLRLLSERHRNITVVGDPNQAIYSFRGADVKSILHFTDTFPDANTAALDVNYRSTQQIVDASYVVVADLQKTNHVRCEGLIEGTPVRFIQELNEIESYPSNFTVLARTNKTVKEAGQLLQRDGILYKICTRDSPRPHLGIPSWRMIPVLDVIRAAEDCNDVKKILAAVKHVIGVGEKTMEHFWRDPADMWLHPKTTNFVVWLANGVPSIPEIYASKTLKLYIDYLLPSEITAEIEYLTMILEQCPNCPTYNDLLAEASVEIRTIHSAKGLEYPAVVVDLRGFKPWDYSDEELAEECRVLYVAMSRAEQQLYLLGNNRYGFPNLSTLKDFIETQQ